MHGDTRGASFLDTGAFLGCWMVRQAQKAAEGCCDFASIFRSYRTILERAEQLQASVLSQSDSTHSKASGEDRKLICLQLAWMRFELCWRAMAICDADASNASNLTLRRWNACCLTDGR